MTLCIMLNTVEDAVNLVDKVSRYDCDADIKLENYYINAKSMLGVIGIGIRKKMLLNIHSEEKKILEDLKEFSV